MSDKKLNLDSSIFKFIDQLVKAAIKEHITLEAEWVVEKEYFEDSWVAQQLHEDVEQTYCLQLADADVEVDLEDEDDPESLTCCYVMFDAVGNLSEILSDHGIKSRIEVQVYNSSNGSPSATLLSGEDVDAEVSLLSVWNSKPAANNGLIEALDQSFGSLV